MTISCHQLMKVPSTAEDTKQDRKIQIEQQFVQSGMRIFQEFGKDVMTLAQSKRVLEGQIKLQKILDGVRGSSQTSLSMEDAEYLCSFHIDNKDCFNQQDKEQMKKMLCICLLMWNPKICTTIMF